MPRIIFFSFLLLGITGAVFYFFFYTPTLYQRALEHRLADLSTAANTQDRVILKNALALAFTESAQIALEMQPSTMPGEEPTKAVAQDFGKVDFLNFIDTVLYSVKDYHFTVPIQSFTLNKDRKTAKLHFNVHAQAQDVTGMSVTGNMQFNIDAPCDGEAVFQSPNEPLFNRVSCRILLRYSLSPSGAKHL